LNTLALFLINGKSIAVEIIGQLVEQRIGEILVLEHTEKAQFCQSRFQSRSGGWLCKKFFNPFFFDRRDLLEVCRDENLAVF